MSEVATLAAVGIGAVSAGLASLAVPRVVRALPEPPEEEPDRAEAGAEEAPEQPRPAKEPYAAIAALPGLAGWSALAGGVAGGLVGWSLGLSWSLLLVLPLVPVGVALAVVDWRTRLLPTRLIAPSYVVLVALSLVLWLVTRDTDALVRGGLGWLAAGLFFYLLWFVYPAGMGFGDVRLSGVLGLVLGHLGWGELLVGLYAGFLLGGIGGLVLTRLRIVDRRHNPFGPWMLLGALVGIVVGAPITAAVFPPLT